MELKKTTSEFIRCCKELQTLKIRMTAMDGCALEIHDLPGELGMYVRTIEGE